MVPGTNVFWYVRQKAVANSCQTWKEFVNTLIDIFFDKETLAKSCAKGLRKGLKRVETDQLCQTIINAIVGKNKNSSITIVSFVCFSVSEKTKSRKFYAVLKRKTLAFKNNNCEQIKVACNFSMS